MTITEATLHPSKYIYRRLSAQANRMKRAAQVEVNEAMKTAYLAQSQILQSYATMKEPWDLDDYYKEMQTAVTDSLSKEPIMLHNYLRQYKDNYGKALEIATRAYNNG